MRLSVRVRAGDDEGVSEQADVFSVCDIPPWEDRTGTQRLKKQASGSVLIWS